MVGQYPHTHRLTTMSTSLSRHTTRAVSSTHGGDIVLPIVMASTLAVAARYSARALTRRQERDGCEFTNIDEEVHTTSGSEEIEASPIDEDGATRQLRSKELLESPSSVVGMNGQVATGIEEPTSQENPSLVAAMEEQVLIETAFCGEPKSKEPPLLNVAVDEQMPIEKAICEERNPQESASPMVAIGEQMPFDKGTCAEPKTHESPTTVIPADEQLSIGKAICLEPIQQHETSLDNPIDQQMPIEEENDGKRPQQEASLVMAVDEQLPFTADHQLPVDEESCGDPKRHESPPSVVVMSDQRPMENTNLEEQKPARTLKSTVATGKQLPNDKARPGNSTGTFQLALHTLMYSLKNSISLTIQ